MRISAAAVVTTLLLLLTGCGGAVSEAPEAPEPAKPETPPVEPQPGEPAPPPAEEPAPADSQLAVDSLAISVEPPPDLRICAGGDVLIGNNLDTLWAGRASQRVGYYVVPFPDPNELLSPLRPLVDDSDIVLLNIEGAIGAGPAPAKCRPGSTRCYAFRQPVSTAAALRRFAEPASLVGNVANNHALDAGIAGYGATIDHLRQAGVHVTGTDTLATLVPSPAGDTVAILGFSPFVAGPDPRDLAAVRRHVARAARHSPRVVVTMHMGAEGGDAQRTPNEAEQMFGEDRGNSVAFAHAAVEAGASLVVGHGPHVLRAVEWVGDALVLYSLGNTLTYGPFNLSEPSNIGAIACVTLDREGRVTAAVLRSAFQVPPGIVAADPDHRGAALIDSLSALDFPGTGARIVADSLVTRRQ
ncbi:MAG: CapA family protein [Gemmatimonadota bacterium]